MRKFVCMLSIITVFTGCIGYTYVKNLNTTSYVDAEKQFDLKFESGSYNLYCIKGPYYFKANDYGVASNYFFKVGIKNTGNEPLKIDPGEFYMILGDERKYHITHEKSIISGSDSWINDVLLPQTIEPGVMIRGDLVFRLVSANVDTLRIVVINDTIKIAK